MDQATKMDDGIVAIDHDIDVRKLLYFALILQHGSMGKAAKAPRMSQAALSISMRGLEEELGSTLFLRTPKGVEPTEKGELLARHARQILVSLSAVEDEFFKDGAAAKGILRFGCLPTLAGSVVAHAIQCWRESYPDLELQVTECPQNELLWGLLRRAYDFSVGIVDCENYAYGLRQRVLFHEQLHVVACAGHPLAGHGVVTLKDLIRFPWISPTTGWRNTALERILEQAGLVLQHKVTVCSSITLLKSLVANSLHLALLPEHAVRQELSTHKLVLLPFHQENLQRGIAVFLREGASLDEASLSLLQLIQVQGKQGPAEP